MRYKNRMMKKHLLRILVILILGLGTAAAIAAYQIQTEGHQSLAQYKKTETSIIAKDFGGDFTLMNQDGETVTQDNFANQWRMIYFGFTYCPAICPTELQKMTQALNALGNKADQIQPLFISVDPERDTIEVMKNYTALFHPRLTGLTGSLEQVEVAKNAYKIYAAKVLDETMSDYTVDHSSFIYFLDPENNLRAIFKTEDTADEITAVLSKILN